MTEQSSDDASADDEDENEGTDVAGASTTTT